MTPATRIFERPPVLLGHRGCGRGLIAGYAENTLDSFLAAVEFGVDWLEVDVRRTADDVLLVAHDPASPDGVFYADITGDEAVARGALRVEALLDAVPDDIGIDFDLKTSMEDAVRDRVATTAGLLAPVAAREARRRPVLVTSFDASALNISRERVPAVPLGLLTWLEFPVGHAIAAAGHLDVQVLAVHVGSLQENRIERATQQRPIDYIVDLVHKAGREFLAWCPEPDFARTLMDAGADAMCVNDIPAALENLRPVHRRTP